MLIIIALITHKSKIHVITHKKSIVFINFPTNIY